MTSPPPTSAGFQQGANNNTLANGLVLSITGPPTVTVNAPFTWELFIINRSEKVHRLALVAIPKRRAWIKNGQRDSVSSIRGGPQDTKTTGNRNDDDFVEPVVDDRILYQTQKNAVQEPTGLLCLSPDVRIGYAFLSLPLPFHVKDTDEHPRPLPPGACYTTSIKFVALIPGVQNLEALRVVDLTNQTQDAVDVKYLPDIVAEAEESSPNSGHEEE
jgi:hypothetical protein